VLHSRKGLDVRVFKSLVLVKYVGKQWNMEDCIFLELWPDQEWDSFASRVSKPSADNWPVDKAVRLGRHEAVLRIP
jgi:hypothetical protein